MRLFTLTEDSSDQQTGGGETKNPNRFIKHEKDMLII